MDLRNSATTETSSKTCQVSSLIPLLGVPTATNSGTHEAAPPCPRPRRPHKWHVYPGTKQKKTSTYLVVLANYCFLATCTILHPHKTNTSLPHVAVHGSGLVASLVIHVSCQHVVTTLCIIPMPFKTWTTNHTTIATKNMSMHYTLKTGTTEDPRNTHPHALPCS